MRTLIPHLAAAFVIAGCAWLTAWQVDRADEKQRILTAWHEREPVAIDAVAAPFDLPRPVSGVGNWREDRQLLIDNQVRDRRTGVFVLTPWEVGDGRVFLVNRGWAPWPSRSAPLPDPPVTAESGAITGVLNRGPAVGARLGQAKVPENPDWPLLVTYYDADRLATVYGERLQPAVVQLDPDHAAHLTGDEWRVVTFGPDRHLGYAMTWATIAIVVAGIWLTLTVRTLRRSRTRG
jgi:surfeit locus 1 family protein